MARRHWIRWLLPVGAVALALASVGCGILGPSGGSNADVRQVVEQWASALETENAQGLVGNYAPSYSYDGAYGGQTAPAPFFWGLPQGTTTVNIISIERDGDHATVRVQINFVGLIGPETLPPPPEPGTEEDRLNNPGFGAPSLGTAPGEDLESNDGTAGSASQSRGMVSLREVAERQTNLVTITFSATVILELQQINGAWFIIAQRQEASTTTIGNGAVAPVIATLLLNGSETPTVEPAIDATVSGTVQNTSEQAVLARLGYRIVALPVAGENFSGPIHTPRRQGQYVLEAEAANFNPENRSAGFATRSIEVIVEGDAGDFSFTVPPDVPLDPAVRAVLEGYIRAIHEFDSAAARHYVADNYSYNGLNADAVSYFVEGLSGFPESVLNVTVTSAQSEDGVYRVLLSANQVSEMGGWVEPVQGGTGSGGGTVNSGTGTVTGGMTRGELGARIRQLTGQQLHQDAVLEFELVNPADWKIAAIRPDSIAVYSEGATRATLSDVLVNGQSAVEVEGRAPLTVTGQVSGVSDLRHHAYAFVVDSATELDVSTGFFEGTLRAPRDVGRWVLTVAVDSVSETGFSHVTAGREVHVTSPAPPVVPTFTVAPGVDLDLAVQAVLEGYIRAIHSFDSSTARTYVADDYNYNGLNAEAVSYFVEGLSGSPESSLDVVFTDARAEGSAYRVLLTAQQVGEMGGGGQPLPIVGGGDSTGMMSSELSARIRQEIGHTLHQDSVLEFELVGGGAWRISAIRPDALAIYSEGTTPPTLSNVLVNGQESVAVEGRAALTVTGQVSGVNSPDHRAYAYVTDSFTGLDISTGSFEGSLAAPRDMGRWVLTAAVDSMSETGFSHVSAGREVDVTSPAPVPTFTVAPGVVVPDAALAVLNHWLGSQVRGDYPGWQALYSQDYRYDGLDYVQVTSVPRLWLYDAVFDTSHPPQLVEAAAIEGGGVRVHGVLAFLGPLQFYPYPGAPQPVPLEPGSDGSTRQMGGAARNFAGLTWELTPSSGQLAIRLERINRAGSATGDLRPFEIGEIGLNEDTATASVPAGSTVFVSAPVDAPDGTPARVRLGPIQAFDALVSGGRVGARLNAPGEPGRYAAEIVVSTGDNMIMDGSTDPSRPDIWPPPPMAISLRAREVHVTP